MPRLSNIVDPRHDGDVREIMSRCYTDTGYMCKSIWPDKYEAEFTTLHEPILEGLNDESKQKLLILAPRGIGKTTIFHGYVMKNILFRMRHFIVYISNSLTLAEMQTENIKADLLGSSFVRKVFGDIRDVDISEDAEEQLDGLEESFSKKAWVAFGNTLVLPRGLGQQIRGLLWKGHRPDLFILDDPEDEEELMNEEIRKKQKNWFFGTLKYATSRLKKDDWRICYLDTLKHEDALPVTLKKLPTWHTLQLSICEPGTFKSLAPEFMSDQEIQDELEEARLSGTIDRFYREMMNIPVAPETASFKSENFKYFDEADYTPEEWSKLETVVIVDPAKSVTPKSDESAAVGLSFDRNKKKVFVRDVVSGLYYPDELYQLTFEMARRIGATAVGFEITGLNEFVIHPVKDYMCANGYTDMEFVELRARGKKEERVRSLISYYRRGLIYHNKSCCGKLEQQLLTFPSSQKWDVMDALAYVVEMLEKGQRYFFGNISEFPDVTEYADIEYEKPLQLQDMISLCRQ